MSRTSGFPSTAGRFALVSALVVAAVAIGTVLLLNRSDNNETTAPAPTTAAPDPTVAPPSTIESSTEVESTTTASPIEIETTTTTESSTEVESTTTTESPVPSHVGLEPPTTPCSSPTVVDQALEGLVEDCEVLFAFYLLEDAQQLFSDPATAWSATNPLENWKGVDVADGRVVGLRLSNLQLGGRFGRLPFLNLTSLIHLDLSNNGLTGDIPNEFADLTKLEFLDLSNNQLTGPVPHGLGEFTRLEHLDLSHNQLRWGYWVGSRDYESNLTTLVYLDLSHNLLSGEYWDNLSSFGEFCLVDDFAVRIFNNFQCFNYIVIVV